MEKMAFLFIGSWVKVYSMQAVDVVMNAIWGKNLDWGHDDALVLLELLELLLGGESIRHDGGGEGIRHDGGNDMSDE